MKRAGFTLIELVIAIAILAITAATLSLNPDSFKHTAKQEAERLAAKLSSLMLKADSTHKHFEIKINKNKMLITWKEKKSSYKDKDFEPEPGCSISWNAPGDNLTYSYLTNRYAQGATITVNGKGGPYYVIIATIGSRVRISNVAP